MNAARAWIVEPVSVQRFLDILLFIVETKVNLVTTALSSGTADSV